MNTGKREEIYGGRLDLSQGRSYAYPAYLLWEWMGVETLEDFTRRTTIRCLRR